MLSLMGLKMGLGFFIRYYFWLPCLWRVPGSRCHYSANTLAHGGEYATRYEIKLHVLLIGTIDR